MSSKTILVLGPEGTGKSLLLKRIRQISLEGENAAFNDIPSTVPTVGTNILKAEFDQQTLEMREVGGVMAPIWKNYFKGIHGIVYVVDASNQFQVSASCMLLLNLLANEKLSNVPFLLVFNKIDCTLNLSLADMKFLFRLSDIKANATQKFDVIESSNMDVGKTRGIVNWMLKLEIL